MIYGVIKRKNLKITSLEVSGHAEYDKRGKDIVCAGVSAVVIGGFNALAQKNLEVDFLVNDNVSKVEIKSMNEELQIILETMVIQLKTIQQSYKKYLNIKEE